jgi:uncharacterized membrane protein
MVHLLLVKRPDSPASDVPGIAVAALRFTERRGETMTSLTSKRASETSESGTRGLYAVGGVVLLGLGLLSGRGALVRGLFSTVGAGLLYQGWTGRNPVDDLSAGAKAAVAPATEPMTVSHSVIIPLGRDATYRMWRNLPNLAAIMDRVVAIEELDRRRSRWRVRVPEGGEVEWISEITDDDPGKAISWRTVDSPLAHFGVVRFLDVPNEDLQTEVAVEMRYMVPIGVLGRGAARLLGEPEKELRADLERLREYTQQHDFMMTSSG